jgi:MFS transporter, DHA3 family, macrolide efflux protein
MGVWGGPKNKVRGILLGDLLNFIALSLCVFLGRTPLVWATGFLVSSCLGAMVNGLSQSIWQAKVPAEYQGRVFSTRRMIAWLVMPVATLAGFALPRLRWLEQILPDHDAEVPVQ